MAKESYNQQKQNYPDSNEDSYQPYTYVELKGSSENDNSQIELILSCTSSSTGVKKYQNSSKNWDGN